MNNINKDNLNKIKHKLKQLKRNLPKQKALNKKLKFIAYELLKLI